MNLERWNPQAWRHTEAASVVARLVLGSLFVVMGLNKALDPVAFLKLVRQYHVIEAPLGLTLIAATLPWFEGFCGLILLAGIAVRGTALVSLAMLVPFTALIWRHAVGLQSAEMLPFCAIRFDCGCGAGEVAVCFKLLENGILILLSLWLLIAGSAKWRLMPGASRRQKFSNASV